MIASPTSTPHGEATAMAAAAAVLSAPPIPVDYRIKAGGFGFIAGSNLTIFNEHGKLAFGVHGQSGHRRIRVLEDAAGHTLFSLVHHDVILFPYVKDALRPSSSELLKLQRKHAGSLLGYTSLNYRSNKGDWQGFRGKNSVAGDLVFTAKRVLHSAFKSEIEVDLSSAKFDDPKPSFRLKGSPFNKSCTIYKGDVVVAQTNLLYKLRKIIYSRAKFRLTIFPGNDHALVIAMVATFLA